MSDKNADKGLDYIAGVNANLNWRDRWVHVKARLGIRRNQHRVQPGLYALGNPNQDSPVLATANYRLSFDALRKELFGLDIWIMVLDTKGINVWCAAGKGTFGTDEVVYRIQKTGLVRVVSHRKLILPQLGAAGVSAHEVQKRSGFRVVYGPVYASDLPHYLKDGTITPEMRRVRFPLGARMVLIPVELKNMSLPTLVMAAIAFVLGNTQAVAAVVASVLAGSFLFPILLPWIPTRDFSSKGYALGSLVVLPFVVIILNGSVLAPVWEKGCAALSYFCLMPTVTAFLALNFTGSTPFTSRSQVKGEMARYIPLMAGLFGIGLTLFVLLKVI